MTGELVTGIYCHDRKITGWAGTHPRLTSKLDLRQTEVPFGKCLGVRGFRYFG